ncbi:hypothetical protein NEHOM01_1532 [Nematocida homosporus]|uniref:uncharacterized protein n=1 Tax=Nematocida homosporus TaxID=1912981 RepID=UPI0022212338|nr:uncharacterized protein NEHOM01_1532 [Nematocida homosporus]KAI5186532.1 hypothetical protein NEHOM01_1532 [Nematocida homosporus]
MSSEVPRVYREIIEEVIKSTDEDNYKIGIEKGVLEEIKNTWITKICEYTDIGEYKIRHGYNETRPGLEAYYNQSYSYSEYGYRDYPYPYYPKDKDDKSGSNGPDYSQYDGLGSVIDKGRDSVVSRDGGSLGVIKGDKIGDNDFDFDFDLVKGDMVGGDKNGDSNFDLDKVGGDKNGDSNFDLDKVGGDKNGDCKGDSKIQKEGSRDKKKDKVEQLDGGEAQEEEELDSNDLSESDCDIDNEETTKNVMLCLFDKVTRVKDKRRCTLKHGFLSIGRTDYTFNVANGDLEW